MSAGILRLAHESESDLTSKLIHILRRRGYVVTPARPELITVGQLAALVRRPLSTVSRSLRRPSCPKYEAVRSKTGRVLRLEPSPRLLDWLA